VVKKKEQPKENRNTDPLNNPLVSGIAGGIGGSFLTKVPSFIK